VQAGTRQTIQLVLILAMIVAAIRVAWIFYERHEEATLPAKQEPPPLNPDYYVTPKKLYPYDLKTAKQQLTKQPAWVKVGYYYSFYPYDTTARRADLSHEAGKLLPLQKIEIKDVLLGPPGKSGERQVLAIFQRGGKSYATAVGNEQSGDYKFYCNDMLFIEDPHELYKHWPADIWQAIDQHQVKTGMSELQADFAIGIGLLEQGGDETDETLDYPNGGKPLIVSYHSGKAIVVKPGKNE
jgi:hypothetical protein